MSDISIKLGYHTENERVLRSIGLSTESTAVLAEPEWSSAFYMAARATALAISESMDGSSGWLI